MNKKITIAIDAMGGDNSPSKTIKGVKLFLDKNKLEDYNLNLYGDTKKINTEIQKLNISSNKSLFSLLNSFIFSIK